MSRPARSKATTPGSIGVRPSGNPNESRLWVAVILNAISDLRKGNELYRTNAIYWFNRKKDEGPGSFIWCCDILNINSDVLREKAMAMEPKPKNLKRMPCKWPHGCPELSKAGQKYCTRHDNVLRQRINKGWMDDRLFEPVRDTRKSGWKKGR